MTQVIPLLILLVLADTSAAPPAAERPFDIETQKPGDKVTVALDGETALVSIRSPSGIGGATIRSPRDHWPTKVILRLHLRGLESLSVSNGTLGLKGSIASHGGYAQRLYLTKQGQVEKVKPKTEIRVLDADGKPIAGRPGEGGYFEITLPSVLLEGKPKSLTIGWIDFFR